MGAEELVGFDGEATALLAKLPTGPALVVIGSTSFYHKESPATCAATGKLLATIENLALITGGMSGIGEGVGRSFFEARKRTAVAPDVFHVLPRGCPGWDYGVTMFAGSDMSERREILGRLSHLYLAIEGGPGTVHEAQVALSRGAVIIAVGRSGGHAGDLYPKLVRPDIASEKNWSILGNPEGKPEQVAQAVYETVMTGLKERRIK